MAFLPTSVSAAAAASDSVICENAVRQSAGVDSSLWSRQRLMSE